MNLPAFCLALLSLVLPPVIVGENHHADRELHPATAPHAAVQPLLLHGFGKSIEEVSTGIVNEVKAGRLLTLEFRVTDARMEGVFLPELLVGSTLAKHGDPASADETVAFEDEVQADPVYMGNGYYRITWKSRPEWANSTRTLTLSFEAANHTFAKVGGGSLQAAFAFRR